MPRLSRWCVRASLLYLAAGFTLGAVMLALHALAPERATGRLLAPHVEFLLIGWTVQLTIGVAFWILPKFGGGTSRGREGLAWCAFALLNVGTLLAGVGPALGAPAATLFLGRVAELAGAASFGLHAAPRVKPFGESRASPR